MGRRELGKEMGGGRERGCKKQRERERERERMSLLLSSFQCPVVEYGEGNETEAFLIVSNTHAYIYKVTAPERYVNTMHVLLSDQHSNALAEGSQI